MFARTTLGLLAFLFLGLGAVAAPGEESYRPSRNHGGGGQGSHHASAGRAVYFMTNEEANAIVALPIGRDGKLSQGTTTPTGGKGGLHVDANGLPVPNDGLASQGSVVVSGDYLFAVNAGSDSVSAFSISPRDPTHLTLLGRRPVPVPGDFPNTVAFSPRHSLVCVGTTGARSGVSCAPFAPGRGIVGSFDTLRPFHLGQITPPSAPPNTVSQTLFSADESLLLTTVKGNAAINQTGFLSAFAVEARSFFRGKASVSDQDVKSAPAGTLMLFGAQPVPRSASRVIVADPAFGAALVDVDPRTHEATTVALDAVPNQAAVCWLAISDATNTAFLGDAGLDRLVQLSLEDASVVSILDLTARNGDPGMIDLRAAGGFVYALSPGNATVGPAITVVEARRDQPAKPVQHFALQGITGARTQGMAVLV